MIMKRMGLGAAALVVCAAGWAQGAAKPKAILHTDAGDITIELYPDKAPKTVESFIGLAKGTKPWTDPNTGMDVKGKPLFSGTKFHRTGRGFMIQAGAPYGMGQADSGFTIPGEPNDLRFDKPGRVAMANKGGDPSAAGSQFFITDSPTPQLDPESGNGTYVIFGQVTSGLDVVNKIAALPNTGGQEMRALQPVTIKSVEIVEAGGAGASGATTGTTNSGSGVPAAKGPQARDTATTGGK